MKPFVRALESALSRRTAAGSRSNVNDLSLFANEVDKWAPIWDATRWRAEARSTRLTCMYIYVYKYKRPPTGGARENAIFRLYQQFKNKHEPRERCVRLPWRAGVKTTTIHWHRSNNTSQAVILSDGALLARDRHRQTVRLFHSTATRGACYCKEMNAAESERPLIIENSLLDSLNVLQLTKRERRKLVLSTRKTLT